MAGLYEIEGREPEQNTAAQQISFSVQDRDAQAERIRLKKEGIRLQIEQGNAPESILYSALEVISILTDDPKFFEACKAPLDAIYSDLAQQSLLADNAAIAAARLEAMQADYRAKLLRQLNGKVKGYKRIESALKEALAAVYDMEPRPDPEEDSSSK